MSETCPHCNQVMVLPYTGRNDMLLVGEYPDLWDKNRGIPFSGEDGEILKYEMSRYGMNIWDCNLTTLWLHDKNKNGMCFQMGVQSLTKEMAGRKVLLMGAELSKYFLDVSIMDVAGIEVISPLFPTSVQFVMMSPAPGTCKHTTHGEFRLAIEKFIKRCKEVQN